MNKHHKVSLNSDHLKEETPHGTFDSALKGFILSIALTLAAYFFVVGEMFGGWPLNALILGLGLIQMWVQLHYFLHLGEEPKPQWNLLAFLFMLVVVFILVLGTLWIMHNLEYRDMNPMQMSLQNQKP